MNSRGGLARALLESRNNLDDESEALLEQWHTGVEDKPPLSETITSESLDGLDHIKLTRISRELHDRVLLESPGYEKAVADLVSTLDRLPLNTAASLYLGLLSSMYLVRESNASRLPPSSPIAQLLFNQQSADYAFNGIYAISKRLSDNEVAPLYIPHSDRPSVTIALDTEPNTSATNQLRSLKVREIELLIPAQKDNSLRLGALFGNDGSTDGRAIIYKACELFAIPIAQVERVDLFELDYTLTTTIGFKRPVDISIPKELPNGE